MTKYVNRGWSLLQWDLRVDVVGMGGGSLHLKGEEATQQHGIHQHGIDYT